MQASHESIYRYVYVVACDKLQRELTQYLRRKSRRRGMAATQGKIPPAWCWWMNAHQKWRIA